MILKYLKYFDYYLEKFARQLGGKGLMDPSRNGEYAVLENVIKQSKGGIHFCFIDGGANIGNHSKYVNSLCRKYSNMNPQIVVVEPFPSTIENLKTNLQGLSYELIEAALGNEEKKISFYSESEGGASGQNSSINHYYLSCQIAVNQTTIDRIIKCKNIDRVNFLKLDVEGSEYSALQGATNALSEGKIDYIQLEYNQTWIGGRGTIEKILNVAARFEYDLFRIRSNDLLSIPSYNFVLDDFFYCNLLLVRKGCKLPLPCKKKASPLI